ncbi:MAG: PadR family transcriptional regulator [Ignisphaera sp.]
MFRPSQKEFEFNTALIILYVLSKGPAHGYEIMRRIKEEFYMHKSPGILYPSLRKLVSMGYIEVAEQGARGRKLLRVYRITDEGAKFLSSNMSRVEYIKRFSRGIKIFEDCCGHMLRESIFRLVEVLPNANRDDLEQLSIIVRGFVRELDELRNRIVSRGG